MRNNKIQTRREPGRSPDVIKPTLLTLAIAQALTFQMAQAASIEVTSNLDDGTDCTLREAIDIVNAGVDQNNGCIINGALGTADAISFGAGVAGSTIVTNGTLVTTRSVSINSGGEPTTIDANGIGSVFSVDYNGTFYSLELDQLTLTGGTVGISAYRSNVTLTNSSVSGNSVRGISVVEAALELTNSTVSGNTVTNGNGGGISATGSNIRLTNTTVTGNTAVNGDGGGIASYFYTSVALTNSTVTGNMAGSDGGGISADFNSTVRLTNSTVTGNTAGRDGGGIYTRDLTSATLINSTVTGNSAVRFGGGISALYSSVILSNSIVANSSGTDCNSDNTATVTAMADSIIEDGSCGTDAMAVDPVLGPLADNGGPTQTHALLAGSPAIDNGTAAESTDSDQRGVSAVGVRDSGAYEFTGNIETMGRPNISRSTDTGIFIWETELGNWVVHVVSGDRQRIVDVDITSTQVLSNVQQVSIEASDVVTILPNSLNLSLNVQAPWLDGVEFTVEDQSSTCISTANVDVPIYVGPNRVQVGRDFGLNTLTACGPGPDIETMGRPNIDRSMDTGIFIWENETNDWVTNVVSGDTPRIVDIDITSTQAVSNVEQVSIEASDVFTILPNGLDLSLNVQAPWLDGVKFTVEEQSNTCISTTNVDVPIIVGPNRVEVSNNFDLNTLTACEPGPDIETIGKPNIDRSTDTGIFIWESQPNIWVSHVVSGDQQRIVDIDVLSTQALSNVQQVSIEASDVFTILPNGLDLSLNVKAPWLDGFKFTEQPQADTCVSTTNSDVPIYVGPDRVQAGNSLNLKTLTSCP